MRAARPAQREAIALAALILAAAAIRLATAAYPLWFDEIASTVFAHQPISRLWSGWMAGESNPPLYYTLLRGWIAAVGDSDVALRALSVALGLVGIVAAWATARRLGGTAAGLAAAALLTVSAAHVDTSQAVRGYVLAQSAALVAIWALIDFFDRRRWPALAAYAAAATVALYAHTTMVAFVALATPVLLWTVRGDRRALAQAFVATGGIALAWAWWGWISITQTLAEHSNFGWIARPGLAEGWATLEQAYLPGYLFSGGLGASLLLLMLIAALGWIIWRDRRASIVLLAILSLGTPLLLFAISQIVPILLVRTLYWASGPAIVLFAVAVTALRPPRLGWIVLGAVLALEIVALAHWLPERSRERWAPAMRALSGLASDGDVLLVEGDAVALAAAHYRMLAPGLRIVALTPPTGGFDHWADGLYDGPHVGPAGACALLERRHRVFALVRGDHDPGRILRGAGVGRVLSGLTDGRQPFIWLWSSRAAGANGHSAPSPCRPR